MKRALFFLLVGAALLAGIPAQAFWQSRDSNYNIAISSGATYTGPGDIVSGATAWYGLRAYNAAYAATPGLAVNVRRASDNVACDFNVTTAGGFGVTTATCNSSTQGGVSFGTFAGSDGTASCTLAGTTGACTGASGTVHVNDVVTGTGLTQPCIVASASNTAPTIEIAGTTTSCGTVGVAETFTFQVAGFVTEAYDQSGSGYHMLQATAGNQPQLLPLALKSGSLPAMLFSGSQYMSATAASFAQPNSVSFVAERTGTFTTECDIFSAYTSSGSSYFFWSTANQTGTYSNSVLTAAANDSALHSIQVVSSGASSAINVDGSATSGSSGNATSTSPFQLSTSVHPHTGYISQVGFWHVGFTPTQYGNLHTNDSTFYGTP